MTAPVPPDANGLREAVEALAKNGVRGFDMNPTRPIAGHDDAWWMDYLRRHEDYWRSALTALLAASEAAPTAGERAVTTYPDAGLPIEHVIDRHGYIWRVVRDGGMATRAHHTGIVTIGISALERESGPLLPATPPADDASKGLSEAERATWDIDPDEWPHTPPLQIFRELYEEDDNLWWRAGSGHGQNAYDAALEEIDRVSAAATRARAEGAAEAGERIARAIEAEPLLSKAGFERNRAVRIARSDAALHTGAQP